MSIPTQTARILGIVGVSAAVAMGGGLLAGCSILPAAAAPAPAIAGPATAPPLHAPIAAPTAPTTSTNPNTPATTGGQTSALGANPTQNQSGSASNQNAPQPTPSVTTADTSSATTTYTVTGPIQFGQVSGEGDYNGQRMQIDPNRVAQQISTDLHDTTYTFANGAMMVTVNGLAPTRAQLSDAGNGDLTLTYTVSNQTDTETFTGTIHGTQIIGQYEHTGSMVDSQGNVVAADFVAQVDATTTQA